MTNQIKTLKQIHDELSFGNIRQFLTNSLSSDFSWNKSNAKKKLDDISAMIAKLEKDKEAAETDLAILTLVQDNHWSLFDVSDHVPVNSESSNSYSPFVGTEQEFNQLFQMKKIE